MKIAFAPSIPWMNDRINYKPGTSPDPTRLEQLLRDQEIESIIIDPHGKPWNPFAGKNTFLQSLDPLRALDIAYRQSDLDAVVSVFEGAATALGLLRPISRYRPKILMWDIGLTDWRLRNKIINLTLPRIDHLMVLGNNQIDHIARHYAPCRSVSAIGHVIDTDFYYPTPLNPTGPILSVGDDIGRDFHVLGVAATEIDRPVVIKASRHPPELTAPNIRVIKERISHIELRALYQQSSMVVVPTRVTANACGVSTILEASASGRPLIVSDNPALRDFIVPDETCLMVPTGDRQALTEAIRRLLAEPETCTRLARGAREFAEKHASFPVFARRLGNEIRRIAHA